MASLFIKDGDVNSLAEKLAEQRGLTKTAAVRLALEHELDRSSAGSPVDQRPIRERMLDFWKRFPLPDELGPPLDKAFWDDLSGGL